MTFEERTLQKKDIYNGSVIKVEEHRVMLPDGRQAVREVVKHKGAVAILCVHDEKVLLIKQFRKALESDLIELPAGKIEPEESTKETALRELEEETGYRAQDIQKIAEFYLSPGFCDELITLYKAYDLVESNELSPDEDEFIEKIWLPIHQIEDWIKSGEIRDAKTLIGLQYFLLDYNNSK